jgi:hypothetical protein
MLADVQSSRSLFITVMCSVIFVYNILELAHKMAILKGWEEQNECHCGRKGGLKTAFSLSLEENLCA